MLIERANYQGRKGFSLGKGPKFPREQMVSKTLWAYNLTILKNCVRPSGDPLGVEVQ